MKWAALYQYPWAVLRELPAIWQSRRRGLITFFVLWMACWFVAHLFDYSTTAWAHAHADVRWNSLAARTSSWGELQRAPLIALALIAFVGYSTRRWRLAWASLAGALAGTAAGIMVNIIKCFFGRPRPSTGLIDGIYWFKFDWAHQSFPSGHATHCAAIAAAVSILAPRSGLALWAGAFGVMWSRWYSERHYVSDLWGGAGLGITIGLLMGWAARSAWQTWTANKSAVTSERDSVAC